MKKKAWHWGCNSVVGCLLSGPGVLAPTWKIKEKEIRNKAVLDLEVFFYRNVKGESMCKNDCGIWSTFIKETMIRTHMGVYI
jgi:hypothetical protein